MRGRDVYIVHPVISRVYKTPCYNMVLDDTGEGKRGLIIADELN